MKSEAIRVALVAAALALVSYWWWSPLIALHQMMTAANAGDADAFNDRVDYPKLCERVKGQLSSMLAMKLTPDSGGSIASAGTAFGTMLGLSLVNTMVEAFVRPETGMRPTQVGEMLPKVDAHTGPVASLGSTPSSQGSPDEVVTTAERKGSARYIAYFKQRGDSDDKRIALVLERSGLATWRLTEIRLPSLVR